MLTQMYSVIFIYPKCLGNMKIQWNVFISKSYHVNYTMWLLSNDIKKMPNNYIRKTQTLIFYMVEFFPLCLGSRSVCSRALASLLYLLIITVYTLMKTHSLKTHSLLSFETDYFADRGGLTGLLFSSCSSPSFWCSA